MPQMAPTYWLMLFIMFMITFYIMLNLIYFSYTKMSNNMIMNKLKTNLKNYNKLI